MHMIFGDARGQRKSVHAEFWFVMDWVIKLRSQVSGVART
jgi:hypothetical protein